MGTHKNLKLWQDSMEFVVEIYKIAKSLPDDEKFGLNSQIKRAAVSIPSNIAEGAARNSTKEYLRFLYICSGSISEIETQLILLKKLKYANTDHLLDKLIEIRKMLYAFIKYLNSNENRQN
jgi:four helix bundle protein